MYKINGKWFLFGITSMSQSEIEIKKYYYYYYFYYYVRTESCMRPSFFTKIPKYLFYLNITEEFSKQLTETTQLTQAPQLTQTKQSKSGANNCCIINSITFFMFFIQLLICNPINYLLIAL